MAHGFSYNLRNAHTSDGRLIATCRFTGLRVTSRDVLSALRWRVSGLQRGGISTLTTARPSGGRDLWATWPPAGRRLVVLSSSWYVVDDAVLHRSLSLNTYFINVRSFLMRTDIRSLIIVTSTQWQTDNSYCCATKKISRRDWTNSSSGASSHKNCGGGGRGYAP